MQISKREARNRLQCSDGRPSHCPRFNHVCGDLVGGSRQWSRLLPGWRVSKTNTNRRECGGLQHSAVGSRLRPKRPEWLSRRSHLRGGRMHSWWCCHWYYGVRPVLTVGHRAGISYLGEVNFLALTTAWGVEGLRQRHIRIHRECGFQLLRGYLHRFYSQHVFGRGWATSYPSSRRRRYELSLNDFCDVRFEG